MSSWLDTTTDINTERNVDKNEGGACDGYTNELINARNKDGMRKWMAVKKLIEATHCLAVAAVKGAWLDVDLLMPGKKVVKLF